MIAQPYPILLAALLVGANTTYFFKDLITIRVYIKVQVNGLSSNIISSIVGWCQHHILL
jgi:hypothetical protein